MENEELFSIRTDVRRELVWRKKFFGDCEDSNIIDFHGTKFDQRLPDELFQPHTANQEIKKIWKTILKLKADLVIFYRKKF